MCTIDKIVMLLEKKGIQQKELADFLGISKNTITDWKSGRIKSYNKHLPQIAEFLGVSIDYLVGKTDTPEPGKVINVFDIPGIEPMPQTKKIPLLGDIACGDPILAEENLEGYIKLDEGINADFALRCRGDSMINARILDGDIVYIRQQPMVDNGQIAAVLIGTEATLKRVYIKGDTLILQPENPAYEPMVYTKDSGVDIRILGLAVAFTSFIK